MLTRQAFGHILSQYSEVMELTQNQGSNLKICSRIDTPLFSIHLLRNVLSYDFWLTLLSKCQFSFCFC